MQASSSPRQAEVETDNWLIVAAMTMCQAMVLFDIAAVGVALPEMTRELGLAPSAASWTVNAYLVTYAAIVALGGRLADQSNSYRVFISGTLLFLSASAICGLTPAMSAMTEAWLIGFRALQGVGGALMVPAALSIVLASVRQQMRGRAMSIYIGGGQVFFILAPTISGVLTEHLTWRAIFWFVVPLGLAAAGVLLATAKAKLADRKPARGRLIDPSMILLIAAIALIVLGLEKVGRVGLTTSFVPCLAIAVGVAALAAFLAREWTAEHPLLPLNLFRKGKFASHAATLFLMQIATVSLITFAPMILQRDFGLAPSVAGLTMLAFIGGWVTMVPVAGILYDRYGPHIPIVAGALISLASIVAWTWSLTHLTIFAQVPAMVLTGVGIGLSILPANTAAVSAGSTESRASTVGLVQTVRQLGGVIGIAVISPFVLLHGTGVTEALHQAQNGFLVLVAAIMINAVVAVVGWRERALSH